MTALRNALLLGLVFGAMVATSLMLYEPVGPTVPVRDARGLATGLMKVGTPQEAAREREIQAGRAAQAQRPDGQALTNCEQAASVWVRNPATIEWERWDRSMARQSGRRWRVDMPLSALNDSGVRKSLRATCVLVDSRVVAVWVR